jgi:hypothetical protein
MARIILTLCIFDSRRNAFSAKFRVPVNRLECIAREKMKQTMASSELSAAVTPEETKSQSM